jgi:hypothetical protein
MCVCIRDAHQAFVHTLFNVLEYMQVPTFGVSNLGRFSLEIYALESTLATPLIVWIC